MQDPSIPVNKKGVLTSFLNGQPMPIPEKDNVYISTSFQIYKLHVTHVRTIVSKTSFEQYLVQQELP